MIIQNQEAFASKLKNLRTVSHLSQKKLAKEINVSRSCLANYESGKRFPSEDILEIIAKYFKVSVDFLTENNQPYIQESNPNNKLSCILKEISSNEKLDISSISPISKIALFEFYSFLKEKETSVHNLENA